MDLKDKVVLVTGGTGSFGKKFTKMVLKDHNPKKLIIFSRDELKQFEMAHDFGSDKRVRFFVGDIRDKERLYRAFHGVDVVIHAAALKHVPILEYNPFEAVKTNILGAENIINAAIDQKVKRVVALSTDKAVNPINLYGATKLCMEKLFISGNSYAGKEATRFSVVRYGNVVGSRGSVIPFFLKKKDSGILPITDPKMTRFWITLEQGVELVLKALKEMSGGEIFIPKIPSMKVVDLAKAIGPDCKQEVIGIRPGEKIDEVLITSEESHHTQEFDDHYIIKPNHPFWQQLGSENKSGKPMKKGTKYSSDINEKWLTTEELKSMATQNEKLEESFKA